MEDISKKQTTAVEWLKVMLEWNYGDKQMLKISWANLDDLLQRAKQMEKEQIENAYAKGANDRLHNRINDEYYNETYGN